MIFGSDNRDMTAHPGPFSKFPSPPTPNYRRRQTWAAHPEHKPLMAWPAGASHVPSAAGFGEAVADVFFIHPTTFRGMDRPWNASWDDAEISAVTDAWPIKHQASLYRSVGRVFAPRYRQAHLRTFYLRDEDSMAALELAYDDVRRAFISFLSNISKAGPIVIAGHSQGSFHGVRILQEFFDGTPLQSRLVAAYLPGYPIPGDAFHNIQFADGPGQVGRVHSWMTFAEGYTPDFHASHIAGSTSIHPILFRTESDVWNNWDMHQGVLTRKFKLRHKGSISAALHNGMVWIKPMRIMLGPLLRLKNWHVADVNLFWENIRINLNDQILMHHQLQQRKP
jgi:hypothetical protein